MSARWCLPHRWGKWADVGSFGFQRYQARQCEKCGKQQQKSFGWDIRK